MTRNAAALEMGRKVFDLASANGGCRAAAARHLVETSFPNLSDATRTFVLWSLLEAETHYVRTERPAMPVVGQRLPDAQGVAAPAGENEGGEVGEARVVLKPKDGMPTPPTANTNQEDGDEGATAPLTPKPAVPPVSRPSRFPDKNSNPNDAIVFIPGDQGGRKRRGDLTKEDVAVIYGFYHRHLEVTQAKANLWKRIHDAFPPGIRYDDWDAPPWVQRAIGDGGG